MSSNPTEEELQGMSLRELKLFAEREFGTTDGNQTKPKLIDFILGQLEPYSREELTGFSTKDLRGIAQDFGMKQSGKASKQELIDFILNSQDTPEDTPEETAKFTEAELKKMTVKDLEALSEERFGTNGGYKTKSDLIQFMMNQQKKSDQFQDLRAYLKGEDMPLPEDGIGGILRLLRENLDLSEPVNPESIVHLAEVLPPYKLLEIVAEAAPLQGEAAVVTSLNAGQVKIPKTRTRQEIEDPVPPKNLERKTTVNAGRNDEIQEILNEIDFTKLEKSTRNARGKDFYNLGDVKDFAKRLGISLTNKNKPELIQAIMDLQNQQESTV